MSEVNPMWRQGFDNVEGALSPHLETFLRSEGFVTGVSVAMQARKEIQRHSERFTRRVLHALNQPAASDVSRILAEVGKLQGDVRRLTDRVDEAERKRACRPTTQPPS